MTGGDNHVDRLVELSASFDDLVTRLRSAFTNKDLSPSGAAAAVAMLVATRLGVIEAAAAALRARAQAIEEPTNG